MDKSQITQVEANLQACDEVWLSDSCAVLSDRVFDTDPSQVLIESSDPQKLRFRLIEWLAEAPNRQVKAERKKKIAETLNISTRQVERLLDRYNDTRLHETTGIERSDKGQHR
ncbi:MAG: helix-turn-helix domain-containing protein, partial [Chamaesiphon sp.]|nr:helix-turn-helix domain-containing protein [Chamaesiphon sp.]